MEFKTKVKVSYLLCHDASYFTTTCLPVCLLMSTVIRVIVLLRLRLWLLLLRELESQIFLVNGWTHGTTTTLACSKHKARRKLGSTSGPDRICLLLLGSQSCKSWGHEALRLRARLVTRLRMVLLLDLALFE